MSALGSCSVSRASGRCLPLAVQLGDYGRWGLERGNVREPRPQRPLRPAPAPACGASICGTEAGPALMAGDPLWSMSIVRQTAPSLGSTRACPSGHQGEGGGAMVWPPTGRASRRSSSAPGSSGGVGDTTLLPEMSEDGRVGPLLWGGRRTAHRHDPGRQRGRGPSSWRQRRALREAYFVTDGDPVVLRRVRLGPAADPGRRASPLGTMPAWLGQALRAIGDPGLALYLPPLPGARHFRPLHALDLTQECTIDDSKARRELGYAPIVSREQGLAELRQSARAA